MAQLSINNVINISVADAGAGVGEYNTSNIALMSHELAGAGFGLDAVSVTGLLAQVGSETLRDYHDDARTDLAWPGGQVRIVDAPSAGVLHLAGR